MRPPFWFFGLHLRFCYSSQARSFSAALDRKAAVYCSTPLSSQQHPQSPYVTWAWTQRTSTCSAPGECPCTSSWLRREWSRWSQGLSGDWASWALQRSSLPSLPGFHCRPPSWRPCWVLCRPACNFQHGSADRSGPRQGSALRVHRRRCLPARGVGRPSSERDIGALAGIWNLCSLDSDNLRGAGRDAW